MSENKEKNLLNEEKRLMEEQKKPSDVSEPPAGWQQYSIIGVFFGLIALAVAALLIKGEDEYAPQEKRYLMQLSSVTDMCFADGTLQEACEAYLADQLPGRIALLSMESALRSVTERELQDVYLGDEGFLFQKVTEEAVGDQLEKNIQAVTDFLGYCEGLLTPVDARVMIVPTKSLILKEYLPEGAPVYDQGAVLDGMAKQWGEQFIDLRDTFLPEPEEQRLLAPELLYYKTDHHWSLDGAYLAATAYLSAAGLEKQADTLRSLLSGSGLQFLTVSENFRGTLYASTLYPFSPYDTIISYAPGMGHSMVADDVKYESLYDEDALLTEDQYNYYLGGNASRCVIDGLGEADRTLLIIKDSYANCFVPFLTDSFKEIHMLDLRYYHGDVADYIAENAITDVLVLYNADNFLSDTNLVQLPAKADLPADGPDQPGGQSDGQARAYMEQLLTALAEGTGEACVLDTVLSYGEDKYDRNIDYLYQIDQELVTDGCIAYAGTGMKADEISIIKPADGKSGRVRRALNKRIERREDDFRAYVPEEADKISQARVFDAGDYIVLVISENPSEMEELIKDIVEGE